MKFTHVALATLSFIAIIIALFVGPNLFEFVNYGTPVPAENVEFVKMFAIIMIPLGILGGLMMRDLMG